MFSFVVRFWRILAKNTLLGLMDIIAQAIYLLLFIYVCASMLCIQVLNTIHIDTYINRGRYIDGERERERVWLTKIWTCLTVVILCFIHDLWCLCPCGFFVGHGKISPMDVSEVIMMDAVHADKWTRWFATIISYVTRDDCLVSARNL